MDSSPLKTVEVRCPICDGDEADPVAKGRDFEYETSSMEFRFVRCRGCGVLYLNPRPDVSELARIYPVDYAPYHFHQRGLTLRVRDFLERRRVAVVRRLLPQEADILDAGCGGPGFLENLRRFGSPGWRLWGNDISPAVTADLAARGFGVLPGRFEQVERAPESFDAIFLKQVIEHLEAPRAVLERAAELLRPGGCLVVETPNVDAWDARWFRRRTWGGYHFPRHWTLFDDRTLEGVGRAIGLEPVEIAFMLSPSFWMQAVHHLLMDRGWPAWLCRRLNFRNVPVMAVAAVVDGIQKLTHGKTSNMRIIFRKPNGAGR